MRGEIDPIGGLLIDLQKHWSRLPINAEVIPFGFTRTCRSKPSFGLHHMLTASISVVTPSACSSALPQRLPLSRLAGTSYPLTANAATLGMVDDNGQPCVLPNSLDAVSAPRLPSNSLQRLRWRWSTAASARS
jgi:argininosuccinate lyase